MYDLKSEGLIRGLKVLFVTICYTSFIGHVWSDCNMTRQVRPSRLSQNCLYKPVDYLLK